MSWLCYSLIGLTNRVKNFVRIQLLRNFICINGLQNIKALMTIGGYMGIISCLETLNLEQIVLLLLVSMVGNVMWSYVNVSVFASVFKFPISKIVKCKFIVIEVCFKMVSFLLLPIPYYRILNSMINIIMFSIFFKTKIEKCCLIAFINFIMTVTAEVFFLQICYLAFPYITNYAQGLMDYRFMFCYMAMVFAFRLCVLYFLERMDISLAINGRIRSRNKRNILLTVSVGYIILLLYTVIMLYLPNDYPSLLFIFDIFIIDIGLLTTLKNIIKSCKLDEKERKIHNLESCNKTLSLMYDGVRGFKHDFQNFVQALEGYVVLEDMPGVKHLCNSVLKECKNMNTLGILNSKMINNPAVYSMITDKYCLAIKKGITMNLDIKTDFSDMEPYNYEFCRILGILLDNAIEAAKCCESKIVNLKFERGENLDSRRVTIENTYINKDIDINAIFKKGYSSKKVDKEEHGIGLWNVKKIIENNSIFHLSTQKGEMFSQVLEINSKSFVKM